ncbi:DUF2262 domain-containing protein [Desulfovibrio litoralis]|uniref:Uncharacterized protein n=1 Tax=Desulfovibrio litoralis DSM 11393 TaxID=1121455 RepID=A0A1M7THM5_9BACT|nr:DUF2262 domain-containing protein [Desulfovibrio litoralis]SHN70206.1 hypothetical protein SAMN02745728_02012 [Desulfovibrio litoralis DSM 11393]
MKIVYKIHKITNEISFIVNDALWDNGTYVFYGYKFEEDAKIELWGKMADFSLEICPHNCGITDILSVEEVPQLDHFISELNEQIKVLENIKFNKISERLACEFIECVNDYRENDEGRHDLSEKEFANKMYLCSINGNIYEKETGLECYFDLYIKDDDDSFDGHVMYVKIENGEIANIELMG